MKADLLKLRSQHSLLTCKRTAVLRGLHSSHLGYGLHILLPESTELDILCHCICLSGAMYSLKKNKKKNKERGVISS